jgi:inosose dehydratase
VPLAGPRLGTYDTVENLEDPMTRRQLLSLPLAAAAATAADPGSIRFAYSGYVWQNNVEEGIRAIARYGFHGIEPFRQHVLPYLEKPQALKNLLSEAGISLVTCSNGGPMSIDFIDPTKVQQTIDDHVRFAQEFVRHFGCRHFKINLGRRPEGGPTDEQLRTMARALNELGKRTNAVGVRLAPHPHIWSPLERPEEVEKVMQMTSPGYVSFVADTAHLTLGGIDPVQFIRKNYTRIVAFHFKDTEAKYRGHTGPTPTQEEHRKINLYKNLGTGGVDFPAIHTVLRQRRFRGWVTLDFDPPRPGEGTIEENIEHNRKYLIDVLGVKL